MKRSERYRLLARYAQRHRGSLVVLGALMVLPAGLTALQPLPMKLLVDNALDGRPVTGLPAQLFELAGLPLAPRTIVVVAALAAVAVAVAQYVVSDSIGLLWEGVGARMVRDVSRDVFDHLQRLSPSYHAFAQTGDSLSRITTDSSSVYTAVSALLVSPTRHLVTLLTVGWAAWQLDPSLTLLLVTAVPVLAAVSRAFSLALKGRASEARRDQVKTLSFVTHVVHALPIVQAFTAEHHNLRTFDAVAGRAVVTARRTVAAEAAADSVATVVGSLSTAVILVVGGRSVLRDEASLGDLLVFVAYARTFDAQVRGLLGVGRGLRLAEVGLERLGEVLRSDDRVREPERPVPLPRVEHGSELVWDHVDFGYEPSRPVLQDVTLRIAPGETVAVVGPTGAGKSTLVSLALRLSDPCSGRVLLDGVDLRAASIADVRRRVAIVRQSPLLLPASVADNIALGRPGASRPEIERAAVEAHAAEFIERLPQGYDTVLAEDGSDLSGGQRQRLAVARAFLKGASVLILDEPTSALDPASEALLVESLERVSRGRTVVIIAHRLSTIRAADRAAVLEAGRIVEVGTHAELMGGGGLYARFQRLQGSGAGR